MTTLQSRKKSFWIYKIFYQNAVGKRKKKNNIIQINQVMLKILTKAILEPRLQNQEKQLDQLDQQNKTENTTNIDIISKVDKVENKVENKIENKETLESKTVVAETKIESKKKKNFRLEHSLEDRIKLREAQEAKHGNGIVVAIIEPLEKKKDSTVQVYEPIHSRKICGSATMEAGFIFQHVRKQLKMDSKHALIMYIQVNEKTKDGEIKSRMDQIVGPNQLLSTLAKSEDGIVYMKYSGESAFG